MTLAPCPECARHVRLHASCCPFCGGDATDAVPGYLRPVSRRELTRAAIFAGAALLFSACRRSSDAEDKIVEPLDSSGGENEQLTTASDDDETEDEPRDEERLAEEERRRRAEEQQARRDARDAAHRRLQEERDQEQDRRRHRRMPQCVTDGTCAAPPYGAPPASISIV